MATDTRVIDSRSADDGASIRRRRECVSCEQRFTTFEKVEQAPLVVVKRSGERQPFDGQKIVDGLMAACKGRPLTADDFEAIVDGVRERARSQGFEVTSEWIGLAVLDQLRSVDQVAYLRFASVYKDFTDVDDFEREARLIKRDPSESPVP